MPTPLIYADHAATTPVRPEVLQAMLPYFSQQYGNPSSLYRLGRQAKAALEQARETVAGCLKAQPEEIFFTSGGSEGDNWAVKGMALTGKADGKHHLITTAMEHPALLESCKFLEREGNRVSYLPVSPTGFLTPEQVAAAIDQDTFLVSVMYANNEIGTIQPVPEIGAICRKKGIPFHTDAVQAAGWLTLDVQAQNIDLLTLSAHKFGGPKGVGVLYCKKGLPLYSLIHGGKQEKNRRAGTENVAGAVGLAKAMELARKDQAQRSEEVAQKRNWLEQELSALPGCMVNGAQPRLPGHLNLSFPGVEGESLLLYLDAQGIAASSGSACSSGSGKPSHVLLALGRSEKEAKGSLRLSIGEELSWDDCRRLVKVIGSAVDFLRFDAP